MRVYAVVALTLVLALLPLSVSAQGIGPLPPPTLTGEWIAGLVYVLLMVAIEFVPRFSVFWDAFLYKRETVAGIGLLTAMALVGLHYLGAFDLQIGPFGWHIVGETINAWLAFLGGSWLIWSMLERAGALPRKRSERDWIAEDGDGGQVILGGDGD